MHDVKSVHSELQQVRQRLADLMRSGDALVDACLEQIGTGGGKMLRPSLVLLFAKVNGAVEPVHINLAAAIELIHTASLLHDDVIDQAALRRNRPTANVLWGNTTAVLLGDFLLSKAFSQTTVDVPQRAAMVLCQAAKTLCIGELRQNLLRGRWDLTEQQYFDIIEAKTAALFSCSCGLGVAALSTDERCIEAAGTYGRNLGIAFQIMDDLADISSTSQRAGKTLGTDLLHEKLTLPVIDWLNQDPSVKQGRAENLAFMSAGELASQLRDGGCLEKAFQQARRHSRLAVSCLSAFGACDALDELKIFAENIVTPVA